MAYRRHTHSKTAARPEMGKYPEKPSPQPSPTGEEVSGCCAKIYRITHKKQPALGLSLID